MMKEREVRKIISGHGGTVINIVCNSHWKKECKFGDRILTVIMPNSPSDRRSMLNWKSWLKRKLNDTHKER